MLNKFFFEVSPKPTKHQRRKLWRRLTRKHPDTYIDLDKITRFFQNKRQYMQRVLQREAQAAMTRSVRRTLAAVDLSSSSFDCDDDDSASSDSESDDEDADSSASSSGSSSGEESD
jgi:hypothetical protein